MLQPQVLNVILIFDKKLSDLAEDTFRQKRPTTFGGLSPT